jgi:hypothetical protein
VGMWAERSGNCKILRLRTRKDSAFFAQDDRGVRCAAACADKNKKSRALADPFVSTSGSLKTLADLPNTVSLRPQCLIFAWAPGLPPTG